MPDQTPEPLTDDDLNEIIEHGAPLSDRTIGALVAAVEDARGWARHGYEIGQRSCTWSDHGVAPAWLTEGHAPEALEPTEDQRRMFGLDEENARLRARIAELEAAQSEPHAYVAVKRNHAACAEGPEWLDDAAVIPVGDPHGYRPAFEWSGYEFLPIVGTETGTRPAVAPALQIEAGAVYRNQIGGELHAVQEMQFLTHGSLMRMPGAIFGEVWLMESRSNEWGTVPYLCTPEGLRQHGYRLAKEVNTDAE